MHEADFLIRFKKGDKNAFKHFYEHYFDIIFYYILSLVHNKIEAEDLTEDVFTSLWEKRKTITIKKSFKNYLLSAAHNKVVDYFNSKNNFKESPGYRNSELIYADETNELVFEEFSDTYLIAKDLRKEVHTAINELPEKCRKIFKLSRLYNMKNTEIAFKLEISLNTVEKQISIALRKLRQALKDYIPLFLFIIKQLNW